MSHIVQIQTEIRDPIAVAAACSRLKLPAPSHRTVQLFSAQATGLAVELPGWRYPVICHTETGQIQYDNFGERWGEQAELQKLRQIYACEKAKIESRRLGHMVTEQQLVDGSIKLTIQVGSAT